MDKPLVSYTGSADPQPMPSTSLLRLWAADPAQTQCWGLEAVADELDRLRRLTTWHDVKRDVYPGREPQYLAGDTDTFGRSIKAGE